MSQHSSQTHPSQALNHLPRPPAKRGTVPTFIVMDVINAATEREAKGQSVIHMEIGQPATPAPRSAREAVKRLIDCDALGYTQGLGVPKLRERIARHYWERYRVEVAPERVVVTTGSSAAFLLSFLALFDAGERVLLPSPGYPCYRHILSALGIGHVILETDQSTRWMPTPEQITAAAGPGVAGFLVASPSNPTGTMLEPARLAALVEACRRAGMWFISDEIYHGLTYGMPEATALSTDDNAIIINSFSKYFSMTGWRIGWMIVPHALVRTVERLATNLYISPPAVSQVAALGAFDGTEELEANKAVYAANRAMLLEGLPEAGLDRLVPADGAFYLYADVSHITDDSAVLARAMLDEAGVAVTPGTDFDEARGSQFLRFSYGGSPANMAEAVARLKRWGKLRQRR